MDRQALEILQPNIAHTHTYTQKMNAIVFVPIYFQSGGEVYCGRAWLSHSRGGQRGSVLVHSPELHRAR